MKGPAALARERFVWPLFLAAALLACKPSSSGVPNTWAAAGLGEVRDLTVDRWNVYFRVRERNEWNIYRLDKAHPGLPLLLAVQQRDVSSIATDGAYVYWTDGVSRQVKRAPRTGGVPPQILASEAELAVHYGIVLDEGHVYYTRGPTHQLVRVPKAGGAAEQLAENAGFVQALDGQFFYGVEGDRVLKVPRAGGAASTLVSGYRPTSRLLLDENFVYFIQRRSTPFTKDGSVVRADKRSGAVTVLARNEPNPACLALDEKRVWFCNGYSDTTSPDTRSICSVSKSGGSVRRHGVRHDISDLAVDAEHVYRVEAYGDGRFKTTIQRERK